jgi:dTDP-4-amino-4,6-dideoxygalactose transaminase
MYYMSLTEEKTIKLNDLHGQYLELREEIDSAIGNVIRTSAFVRGPYVEEFEQRWAASSGATHCVSCANGTDALFVAMKTLGLGLDDEVITTAMSWIATSEAITLTGAQVVFCDIDPSSFTLDTSKLEALVTSRTKGIIPVHLYGQPVDMDPVLEIARRHGLWVLEDCAQAHLARYKGRHVGTMGIAGTFSFYPGKNLGAMGDAGIIVTNDAALAKRMAMFARHGGINKGDHAIEGINSRMDGIQAAILTAKLNSLETWTKRRMQIATLYQQVLKGISEIQTPCVRSGVSHVYHLYVVRAHKRDQLREHLLRRGIETSINYPCSLPFLQAYSRLHHTPAEFPEAFRAQKEILSLPMHPYLSDADIDYVGKAIVEFYAEHGGSSGSGEPGFQSYL